MALHDTRFTPRQPGWRRDLPERDAPPSRYPPHIGQDSIIYFDDRFLAISGESNNSRGVMAVSFLGGVGIFLVAVAIFFLSFSVLDEGDGGGVAAGALLLIFIFLHLIFASYRSAISIAKNEPLIFDRVAKKVYIYSQNVIFMKPFSPWPVRRWVFSWDMVQSEVQSASGFNGFGYQIRYLTLLTICKPGTNEVMERLVLVGDDDPGFWEYLRRFMEHGPEGLPKLYIPNLEPSFKDNFFHYMRNLDPGERGKEERKQEGRGIYLTIPLNLLLFPLFAAFGIGQHIALKLAPKAKWSPEIAEELKAAGYQGPSIKE